MYYAINSGIGHGIFASIYCNHRPLSTRNLRTAVPTRAQPELGTSHTIYLFIMEVKQRQSRTHMHGLVFASDEELLSLQN